MNDAVYEGEERVKIDTENVAGMDDIKTRGDQSYVYYISVCFYLCIFWTNVAKIWRESGSWKWIYFILMRTYYHLYIAFSHRHRRPRVHIINKHAEIRQGTSL